MNMCELIVKKKRGGRLNEKEIDWIVQGYTAGEIPDYQMSAMLMAICFTGMDEEETKNLTLSMAKSGDLMDLSAIHGKKIDKHSTGGVGDKTTLVIGPLAAAAGVPVAKMSGRGLGHTGGTIDKLESFHGFHTSLTPEQFIKNVNSIHIALAGQTANLAPADKKIYALRDVTGTVDQMSLIASSIMSKKLASGADGIVLDVKTGDGAFMKTLEDSKALAREMVQIGTLAGRDMSAVISDMDQPLGYAVGNALEVKEAIATLNGNGPEDLRELVLVLTSLMVVKAGKAKDIREARILLEETLDSGKALQVMKEWIVAQGGTAEEVEHPDLLPQALCQKAVCAEKSGFVTKIHTEEIGRICMLLGGGRAKKGDPIDLSVGLVLRKKVGDPVHSGESLAILHANDREKLAEAKERLLKAYEIKKEPVAVRPLIWEILDGTEAE